MGPRACEAGEVAGPADGLRPAFDRIRDPGRTAAERADLVEMVVSALTADAMETQRHRVRALHE